MNIKKSVKPICVAIDDKDQSKGVVYIPFDRRQALAFMEFIRNCQTVSTTETEKQTVPIPAYRTSDGRAVYSARTMNGFFKIFAAAPRRTKQ